METEVWVCMYKDNLQIINPDMDLYHCISFTNEAEFDTLKRQEKLLDD